MAWSPEVFQLPIPPILFIIPPSHPAQWLIRLFFLVYTFTIAVPLIAVLVPFSIVLKTLTGDDVLLAIHPDNLPPQCSYTRSVRRSIMVYTVGTIVWAITGVGNAPESSEDGARWLTRTTCWFVELVSGWRLSGEGRFEHGETTVQPLDDSYRMGALREGTVKPITMFTLDFNSTSAALSAGGDSFGQSAGGKAILFLAGGGYVTGTPLAHPFIFSLARRLSAKKLGSSEAYTVYAPNVRKSLDRERSFPIPLLDALAAYADLRARYDAADITIMGDSAGGGLTWSVVAYLAVLDKLGESDLGVPGRAIMISPWLALPPVLRPVHPDQVDTPQLFNAARCYMARYPIFHTRPDPFAGDLELWSAAAKQALQALCVKVGHLAHPLLPTRVRRKVDSLSAQYERTNPIASSSIETIPCELPLDRWLEHDTFTRLTSHHPLVSPSTDITSPFLIATLRQLAGAGTKILVHIGTAEWFYLPGKDFAAAAKKEGVEVRVQEEPGGFHSEACIAPADFGGASGRLVKGILAWLNEDAAT